jgi:hypothetical protein
MTEASTTLAARHPWRFFRAGGFDQVRLDRGPDLLALDQLDQKLWVALSCPTRGLEFDERTLALIDSDGDGHIRAPELLAAIAWAAVRLKDADLLAEGADPLPLIAINDSKAEGQAVLASARRLLSVLGKSEAKTIGSDEASAGLAAFTAAALNGDGIVPPSATADAALAQLIADIVASVGGESTETRDRNGEAGVSQALAERFFAEARAWLAWQAEKTAASGHESAAPAALAAVAAVRDKVDDFFVRCRLAAFDLHATGAVNGSEADFAALASHNLATDAEALSSMAALPLARVEAGWPLPLDNGVNPAWAAAIATLRDTAVRPLLGPREKLSEADWLELKTQLNAHLAWLDSCPATPVAALGAERLAELVGGPLEGQLLALIAADAALQADYEGAADVERLAHLLRDLGTLANNFVSFRDFYTRHGHAIFQAGTLYLDGRSCELTVRVDDATKHAAIAALSRICLVYCDCRRGEEKITIAAAFTAGDSDQLMVGRNGVFYDRQGRDWHASIVKIVDHPISIRQAFWAPYRKIGRMIGEQLQKFAAAKANAAEQQAATTIASGSKKLESAKPAEAAKTPAQQAFDVGKFAGIFAAIGLAIGAIGSAVASVALGFFALRWWQMPLALGGLVLAVSGPSMLLAWFKLRSRTLGPILDANGWAVNARARINIPFGTTLTQLAKLPDGAERALTDPYADKRTPLWVYVVLLVLAGVLLWGFARVAS